MLATRDPSNWANAIATLFDATPEVTELKPTLPARQSIPERTSSNSKPFPFPVDCDRRNSIGATWKLECLSLWMEGHP